MTHCVQFLVFGLMNVNIYAVVVYVKEIIDLVQLFADNSLFIWSRLLLLCSSRMMLQDLPLLSVIISSTLFQILICVKESCNSALGYSKLYSQSLLPF